MSLNRRPEPAHMGSNELRSDCPCKFGGDVLALWEANERAGRATRLYGEGPLAMIVGPLARTLGLYDVELYIYCGRCGKQHPSCAPARVTIDAPYARLSRYETLFRLAGWQVDTDNPVSLEVFPVLAAERIEQETITVAKHREDGDGERVEALTACAEGCTASGRVFGTWFAVKRGEIDEAVLPLIGSGPRATVMGASDTWWPWSWLDMYAFCASCGRTFEGLNGHRIRAGRRRTRTARIKATLLRAGWVVSARLPAALFPTFTLRERGCGGGTSS